jgi:hypothetical protein
MTVFAVRAAELTEDRPELAGAVEPLLKAREAIERQIADLNRKVTAGLFAAQGSDRRRPWIGSASTHRCVHRAVFLATVMRRRRLRLRKGG